MNHYIFIATGNDTEQNGKERTEYRHEMLPDREEAFRSAARLWRSLISAGWNNVDIEIKEVTETITIAPTKGRNNDNRRKAPCTDRDVQDRQQITV